MQDINMMRTAVSAGELEQGFQTLDILVDRVSRNNSVELDFQINRTTVLLLRNLHS
jgi:hypothetical protein